MSVSTTTHINFRGQAREALGFYATVFDGTVMVATYTDIHQVTDPDQADSVAWGQVEGANGFRVMAYDVQTEKPFDHGQNAFYIALRGTDTTEIQTQWDRLAEGAEILTTLAPAVFAPLYGMLTDRFGVTWIIDVTAPAQA
jgi:PhnB protein